MLSRRPHLRAPTSVVAALLVVAGSLLLAGCGESSPSAEAASAPGGRTAAAPDANPPRAAAPEARHVTVSYPSAVVTMTGFYIANQEGYLREEGVDAEMVRMT